MTTTKNINGIGKPPIDRYVNTNCTDCCPQLECVSYTDAACAAGKPEDIFHFANGPKTYFASPKKVYVDSFGWKDNGCDCTNLNASFPLSLVFNALFQTNAYFPITWGYVDSFCQVGLLSPDIFFSIPGGSPLNHNNWVLELVNGSSAIQFPGHPDFSATYTCPVSQFSGCGSAVFTFYRASNSTSGGTDYYPEPPCCSSFPETIIVRTDEDDSCNCICNTLDFPGPDVFYFNYQNDPPTFADPTYPQNAPLFRDPSVPFGWFNPGGGPFSANPFFSAVRFVCCNGKIYMSNQVNMFGTFEGSGCSWVGKVGQYVNQPFTNPANATLTCDPL